MKKALALLLFSALGVAGIIAEERSAATAKPSGKEEAAPFDVDRYKTAVSDSRRKLFEDAMSGLAPETKEIFWAAYKDYESEKNEIATVRGEMIKKFTEAFSRPEGLSDDAIVEAVHGMLDLQHENIDLRLKYFGVLSERVGVKTAGRFALVDDYVTTSTRLEWLNQIPFPGDEKK